VDLGFAVAGPKPLRVAANLMQRLAHRFSLVDILR
jgi:hypothetical protein